MNNKFLEGLTYGAGFAISFITLWYIAAFFIAPIVSEKQLEQLRDEYPAVGELRHYSSQLQDKAKETTSVMPFHDLGIDEQIAQSSVIALIKYEEAPDGQMKAIIKEFLKKDSETLIYYNVGDEYHSSSYYPRTKTNYGDGVVIFFTGSPARMRMSMSYSGDRIRGLGDLPLELFREKCDESTRSHVVD